MSHSVLVIGSGGREHALSWKLAQSTKVSKVFVSPGNAGTQSGKVTNIALNIKDHASIGDWCKEKQISLVIVGPEDPLAAGIVDDLEKRGLKCFGPSAKAAQIEASKAFSKDFMVRHGIPTAKFKTFTELDPALDFIKSADFPALVVKASGLAAGKGVIVAKDKDEACGAAREILEAKRFGAAGAEVVIEELLEGEEVSCLAFTDGSTIACMPPAQDHKRLKDGDEGPNTGGMGAYCPCPLVSKADLEMIQRDCLQKAVDGMKKEGAPYVGVLYAGLMLTKDGPKVLEYNCRFGDPETQVLLPLLKSDLFDIAEACANKTLSTVKTEFLTDSCAVAVVAASNGYPGSYKKGFEITGLEKVEKNLGHLVFHAGTKLDNGQVLTNGGRVLSVVAVDKDLTRAAKEAQTAMSAVQFEGKVFRADIAQKALVGIAARLTYTNSGVNISAGESLVKSIKPYAAATSRPGCKADLGLFGGVFDLKETSFKDPLLVSGTDGVGTKLKIAQLAGIHNTIGIDLVAMCANDVLCHGAEPLYFLDYFACGKLDVGVTKTVIESVSHGCQVAGCALLGGETAEMPGMYQQGEYDLAGFAVGAVERPLYLPKVTEVKAGDVVIGLPSSGIHSNGFSLVRRVVEHCGFSYDMTCPYMDTKKLGESLLTPTKIYVKTLLPALQSGKVKAAAHITGGGLPGNMVRILPSGTGVDLNAEKWRLHPVFGWLAAKGNIEPMEMSRTFNCGIGMTLITDSKDTETVLDQIRATGEDACVIGNVVTREQDDCERIKIQNLKEAIEMSWVPSGKHKATEDLENGTDKKVKVAANSGKKKRVGVLISGTGTNLQSLIDHTQSLHCVSAAEIVLVISNKPDVQGLKRAEAAGIPTKVICHQDYKTREAFDDALHEELTTAEVDIVCLAGFMRILTGTFVKKWAGQLINVHPSLLPAFKGANAHKMALEAGVAISGCSVHFVIEEVDAGAILVQQSVPVFPSDTENSLQERVKTVEHEAYPQALELLASGKATMGDNGKVRWNL